MSYIFIVSVAGIIVMRFAWTAVIMLFCVQAITSPAAMLGVIIGLVIVGAAALQERLPDGHGDVTLPREHIWVRVVSLG
jgi:hypothetical protein